MGQIEINQTLRKITNPSVDYFTPLAVLGKGAVGKVYKVQLHQPKALLALKQMSKVKLFKSNMLTNVFQEKNILSELYHPFIINMYASFQDEYNLYMILDYGVCKDLRYQIKHISYFTESQIQFIAACLITALDYIHFKGIAHRDIKPENVICDDKGFVRLTDFGIAKRTEWALEGEISGTSSYMAPEVVFNCNKACVESDWYSLGIMLYELVTGKTPYKVNSNEELKKYFSEHKGSGVILKKDICEYECKDEECYSQKMIDFINELLVFDKDKRLGANGVDSVKCHPWFEDFNWKGLYYKTVISPIKFSVPESKKHNKHIQLEDNYHCNMNTKLGNINDIYEDKFKEFTFMHILSQQKVSMFNCRANIKRQLFSPIQQKDSYLHTITYSTLTAKKSKLNPIQLRQRRNVLSHSLTKNAHKAMANNNHNNKGETIAISCSPSKKKYCLKTPAASSLNKDELILPSIHTLYGNNSNTNSNLKRPKSGIRRLILENSNIKETKNYSANCKSTRNNSSSNKRLLFLKKTATNNKNDYNSNNSNNTQSTANESPIRLKKMKLYSTFRMKDNQM